MRFPCPFASLVRDIPRTIGERKSSLREACQFVILRITGRFDPPLPVEQPDGLAALDAVDRQKRTCAVFNHLLGAYKVPRGLQLAGQPLVGDFFNARGADR